MMVPSNGSGSSVSIMFPCASIGNDGPASYQLLHKTKQGYGRTKLGMKKSLVIKDVESVLSGPLIKSIPIVAFLLNLKIRKWFAIVVNPVKSQDRNICLAHGQSSQVVKAMVDVVIHMTHFNMIVVWVESLAQTLKTVELVVDCQLAKVGVGIVRKFGGSAVDLPQVRCSEANVNVLEKVLPGFVKFRARLSSVLVPFREGLIVDNCYGIEGLPSGCCTSVSPGKRLGKNKILTEYEICSMTVQFMKTKERKTKYESVYEDERYVNCSPVCGGSFANHWFG